MTGPNAEPQERTAGGYYPPTDNPKSHCVSWRMTAEEHAFLLPLFAAFPDRRPSTAMRWLLNHPEVRSVMVAKMREGISA